MLTGFWRVGEGGSVTWTIGHFWVLLCLCFNLTSQNRFARGFIFKQRHKKVVTSTIMDKSEWDTPWKNLFRWTHEFFNFQFSLPLHLPFSILQPQDSVHRAYFNIKKGKRGLWHSTKKNFFVQLWKDANSILLCSNVSTLLSMIVDLPSFVAMSYMYYGAVLFFTEKSLIKIGRP